MSMSMSMSSLWDAVQGARQVVLEKSDEFYLWLNPEIANLDGPVPVKEWLFVGGDVALMWVIGYLLFVLISSQIMKRRKNPINVKWLQYIYNPVQVILCSWMFMEAGRQAYLSNFSVYNNEHHMDRLGLARVVHIFYLSKILDFLDTVFIILGKNWRQLTFLHVYHHMSIFLTYWSIINAGYDGDVYLTVVLNGFVHTVMYMYYMLTSLGLLDTVGEFKNQPLYIKNGSKYILIDDSRSETDKRRKVTAARRYSPSWKKFITVLQMVQFILMNVQALVMLLGNAEPSTSYPRNIALWYLIYVQSMFWLFFNFARKMYCGKKKSGKKKSGKKKSGKKNN